MTTEDLLMEIQDTDELLYTQEEAELMLDYKEALKDVEPQNEEQKSLKKELDEKFTILSQLIVELNDRVELSSNNVTDPSKEEINSLKQLFGKIEDLDFETSDKYKYLTGKA